MEELIKKASNGDKDAFTELIMAIKQDLYKIAKIRLISDEDAEDAIQETVIEMFKRMKKFNEIRNFKAWYIKILINKCNKIYNKKKNNNISIEKLELEKYYISDNYKTESDIEFFSLINILNYDEKMAMIMFYKEDFTTKEISKILRTNENTIKARLHRGKEKIKNRYERSEENGFTRAKN